MNIKQSFKLGFLHALAEQGLTPSRFMEQMEKRAISPVGIIGATYLGGQGVDLVGRAGKALLIDAPHSVGEATAAAPEVLGLELPFRRTVEDMQAEDLIYEYMRAARNLRQKAEKLRRKALKRRKRERRPRSLPTITVGTSRSTQQSSGTEPGGIERAQQLYERAVAGS